MTIQVFIDRESGTEAPSDERFVHWIETALREAGIVVPAQPELSLRINGIEEMSALNSEFRGKTGPTNVLSFPADLPDGVASGLLGDIVICSPVVLDEANEQHKTSEQHWAHMTVHGLLHLLGFDHIEDSDAEIMERLEITLLGAMGYPDPYQLTLNEQRVQQQ